MRPAWPDTHPDKNTIRKEYYRPISLINMDANNLKIILANNSGTHKIDCRASEIHYIYNIVDYRTVLMTEKR